MSLRLLIAASDKSLADSYELFFARKGFEVETINREEVHRRIQSEQGGPVVDDPCRSHTPELQAPIVKGLLPVSQAQSEVIKASRMSPAFPLPPDAEGE